MAKGKKTVRRKGEADAPAQKGDVIDAHKAGGAHARLVEPEDNFMEILKRYGWVVALIVVGIIGFVGFASYKSSAREKAGVAQYQAIADLNANSENGDALVLLQETPSALSDMKEAQVALKNGDQEAAQKIFAAMSENKDFSQAMRDYARLQIMSLSNGAGAKDLAESDLGSPFIFEAKLLEADQLVAAGQEDQALILFDAMLANVQAPSERALIESMILALDGELPAVQDAPRPVEEEGSEADAEADAVDDNTNNETENGQ